MKRKILSLFILSLSVLSYGQENYDEIFDDGVKNSKLTIGTDIMTLSTGTVNVNVGFNLSENIQLKAGLGATPFGIIFDATAVLSEEYPMFQRDLNTGYFLSGGVKYFLNKDHGLVNSGSGAFYGVYLERWKNSNSLVEGISYKRTKFNIVGGSNIGLFGNFDLDFEYGVSVGLFTVETSTENMVEIPNSENAYPGSNLIYGINLGLGINYKL